MSRFFFVATLVLPALVSCASVYPIKYPFDKEKNTPPSLPWFGEPYEEKGWENKDNPGGYYGRLFRCDPYSEDRYPYQDKYYAKTVPDSYHELKPPGFRECRYQALHVWKATGGPGYPDLYTKNCTDLLPGGNTKKSTPALYGSGKFNGKELCKEGSCCKFMNNQLVINTKRIAKWWKEFETLASVGVCTDVPPQEFMCPMMTVPHFCWEYFGYTGKDWKPNNNRPTTFACYDSAWHWFMKCPTYKTTKAILEMAKDAGRWEMPQYTDKLSNQQLLILEPLHKLPDRVCHPYSYYYPDFAGASKSLAEIFAPTFVMFPFYVLLAK